MPDSNYRAGDRGSKNRQTRYRLPFQLFPTRQDWQRYRIGLFHQPDVVQFRAQRDRAIRFGGLPTKPLQTASAAIPLPPRRRSAKPLADSLPPRPQAAPAIGVSREPFASPPIPDPEMPHQEASARRLPNSAPPLLPIHRKRTRHHASPAQAGIFAGVFTALIASIIGIVWWLEAPDQQQMAQAQARQPLPPHGMPSWSGPGTRPIASASLTQQRSASFPATAGRSSNRSDRISGNERSAGKNAVAEPDSVVAKQESKSQTPVSDPIAPETKEPRENKVNKSDASEKRPKPKENRTSNTTNKKERAAELDRLRAQAFAETSRDRIETIKRAHRSSGTIGQAGRTAAKAAPERTASPIRKASTADQFNQCKRRSSFLEREKCKWRVCAGKWGQNGCPAYKHDIASY